jgi:predicted Rossmann fold flavoprotein
MDKTYDIIIVGAGASGIFAATQIDSSKSVLVIDANEKKLRKLFVSGGGRCNFTNINASKDYYASNNSKFCISALRQFTPQDFIDMVEEDKIPYSEKHMGQMFCDDSSLDIIKMLDSMLGKNVQSQMKTKVLYAIKAGDEFKVKTNKGLFKAKTLIVASGGKSFDKLQASDIGFKIAEGFDIPVIEPQPALVGLASKQFTELSGSSTPVVISINPSTGSGTRKISDDLLFTHKGLSGPAILKASLFAGDKITINFYPKADVFEFLKEKKSEKPKAKIDKTLIEIMPKKAASFFLKGINIETEMANISDKTLRQVASKINQFEFAITGTLGYDTAEVTKGGVDTKYISSKTMESTTVPNLYFIGEVLDVTGYLGGYNLQWAWSSSYACAQALSSQNDI